MLTAKKLFSKFYPLMPCPLCRGRDGSCNRCGGTGYVFKEDGTRGEVSASRARQIAVLCYRVGITHIAANNGIRKLDISCGRKKRQVYVEGSFNSISKQVRQFCKGCRYGNCIRLKLRLFKP